MVILSIILVFLKNLMTIIVFKFGYTDNLARRMSEHVREYAFLESNVELKWHIFIDKEFTAQAETALKKWLMEYNVIIDHPKYKELVAVNKKFLKIDVKPKFASFSQEFAGRLKDLHDQIRDYQIQANTMSKILAEREAYLLRVEESHKEYKLSMAEHIQKLEESHRNTLESHQNTLKSHNETIRVYQKIISMLENEKK